MKRKIYSKLVTWKNNSNRRPLLLNGARQVGKSYILQELGKQEFNNYIYVNLKTDKVLLNRLDGCDTHNQIIRSLESTYSQKIVPGKTLIIFDEIQLYKSAITLIERIHNEAPEYHIAATGSMIGFSKSGKYSLSAYNKYDIQTLYSMDFEEFLWASNRLSLAENIRAHYNSSEPLNIHSVALDFYYQYIIVGGLPAAVEKYVTTYSFAEVATIQRMILDKYKSDISKYAPNASPSGIIDSKDSTITKGLENNNRKYYSIATQICESVAKYENSLEWLTHAGITLQCKKSLQGTLPIKSHKKLGVFKYYMSDTGLLTLNSGISPNEILSPDGCQNSIMGIIAKNHVAQYLANNSDQLVYWRGHNTAQTDFIVERNGSVIPIVVENMSSFRSKSTNKFLDTYKSAYGIHISLMNFSLRDKIKTVPFYAAFCI